MSIDNKFDSSIFTKLLILFYAPFTCWFGFYTSTLLIEKAYLLVLVLFFVYLLFTSSNKIILPAVLLPLAIWFLWSAFSAFSSVDPTLSVAKLAGTFSRAASVIIVINFVLWSRCVSCLLYSYVLATLVSGMLIILLPADNTDLGGRLIGTTGNANSFGIQVTASIAVAVYLILNARSYLLKLFNVTSVIFFLYLIIGSGSRKAIVGVFIIIAIFGVYQFIVTIRKSAFQAIASALVAIVILIAMPIAVLQSEHADRFIRLYEAYVEGDKSAEGISEKGRIEMYKLGWQTAIENPVFGIGLDNFRTVKSGFLEQSVGTYAHSNYIELIVGTGFLGFVLYYSMWVIVLYQFWTHRKINNNLMVIGVSLTLVTLLYDFAGVSYYHKVSWLIFALIFYCLEHYKVIDKYNASEIKRHDGATKAIGVKDNNSPKRYLHLK